MFLEGLRFRAATLLFGVWVTTLLILLVGMLSIVMALLTFAMVTPPLLFSGMRRSVVRPTLMNYGRVTRRCLLGRFAGAVSFGAAKRSAIGVMPG